MDILPGGEMGVYGRGLGKYDPSGQVNVNKAAITTNQHPYQTHSKRMTYTLMEVP